jgi:hypothetical protein
MARAKKEARKWTPQERAIDVWNQQLFFIRKKFPDAEREIQTIERRYMPKKKDEPFVPTEEATNELRDLYAMLNQIPAPSAFTSL